MGQTSIRYYEVGGNRPPVPEAAPVLDLSGPTQWLAGATDRAIAAQYKGKAVDRPKPANLADARRWLTPAFVAELMTGYLAHVGSEAFKFFERNMPSGYRLDRTHKAFLMPEKPHLGWCQLASIVTPNRAGERIMIRVFYANFEAAIDTDPNGRFFNLRSQDWSNMFFAVAFKMGADGKFDVIDRNFHHSGISFLTTDPATALDNVVKLRTGMNLEGWRKLKVEKQTLVKNGAPRF
jgi:hypothetical protein